MIGSTIAHACSTSSARVNSEASPSIASSSSVSYASGESTLNDEPYGEVHVDGAHVESEARHLGREAQHDALVGLDADRQQVGLGLVAGRREQPVRHLGNWMAISVARLGSRLPVRR